MKDAILTSSLYLAHARTDRVRIMLDVPIHACAQIEREGRHNVCNDWPPLITVHTRLHDRSSLETKPSISFVSHPNKPLEVWSFLREYRQISGQIHPFWQTTMQNHGCLAF